jgi:hypothetical protein
LPAELRVGSIHAQDPLLAVHFREIHHAGHVTVLFRSRAGEAIETLPIGMTSNASHAGITRLVCENGICLDTASNKTFESKFCIE